MDFITLCSGCGKTSRKDFIYCPWCGLKKTETDDKAVIETVFERLAEKQSEDRMCRIRDMERKIADIEREIDTFLETK